VVNGLVGPSQILRFRRGDLTLERDKITCRQAVGKTKLKSLRILFPYFPEMEIESCCLKEKAETAGRIVEAKRSKHSEKLSGE
jgi:hypothetical protein